MMRRIRVMKTPQGPRNLIRVAWIRGTLKKSRRRGEFRIARARRRATEEGGERNMSIAMMSDFGHVGCAQSTVTGHMTVQESVLRQDGNTVYRDGV